MFLFIYFLSVFFFVFLCFGLLVCLSLVKSFCIYSVLSCNVSFIRIPLRFYSSVFICFWLLFMVLGVFSLFFWWVAGFLIFFFMFILPVYDMIGTFGRIESLCCHVIF